MRRWRVFATSICLTMALSLFPCFALAENGSRVVVLTPHDVAARTADAAFRLAGELRAAGFTVDLVETGAGVEPTEAITKALDDGNDSTFVAIFIGDGSDGASEVRISDRVSRKTTARTIAADGDAGAVAIRTSELLRANLLELASDPAAALPTDVARWIGPSLAVPPPPETPPPPAPTQKIEKPPPPFMIMEEPRSRPEPPPPLARRWRIGADLAVLASFTGFTPAVGPAIDAHFAVFGGFELGAKVAVPFASADVQNGADDPARGTATLRHGYVDVSAEYRIGPEGQVIRPALGGGFGVYVLDATGHEDVGVLPAFHHTVASFAPSLDAELEFRFHDRVRGQLGVCAFFPLPDPVLVFDGARASHAGEPMLLSTLGVRVAL